MSGINGCTELRVVPRVSISISRIKKQKQKRSHYSAYRRWSAHASYFQSYMPPLSLIKNVFPSPIQSSLKPLVMESSSLSSMLASMTTSAPPTMTSVASSSSRSSTILRERKPTHFVCACYRRDDKSRAVITMRSDCGMDRVDDGMF